MLRYFFVISIAMLVSCSSDKEIDANGAKIIFKEDVEGENLKLGDSVYYHLKFYNATKLKSGELKEPITNTYNAGRLMKQLVKKPLLVGGVEESFKYLSKGDSVIVLVNGSALYSNPNYLIEYSFIEKGDQLEYYLKIVDVKKNTKK